MKRTIKQISCTDYKIYALADDGTLWELNPSGAWSQHDPLPDAPDLERVITPTPEPKGLKSHDDKYGSIEI